MVEEGILLNREQIYRCIEGPVAGMADIRLDITDTKCGVACKNEQLWRLG